MLFCLPPRGTVNGGLTVLLEIVSIEVAGVHAFKDVKEQKMVYSICKNLFFVTMY